MLYCASCGVELSVTDPLGREKTVRGPSEGAVLAGRYRIVRQLGLGGMGAVYLAQDCQLEMPVAVKVLQSLLSQDPGSVRRLIAEAKASMLLAHPNIVRVHNFEDGPELKFLVMEYVEGENLTQRIARLGKLNEGEVRRIGAEICKGLEHAHAKKVIHRDLKPANVMVGQEGTCKIADFGIARICRDSISRLTSMQDSGTLLYMSPEQLAGESNEATDLYSLGVVLYEMLSGEPPFNSGDISYQIREVAPKPLQGVSPDLNAMVLRCLSKQAAARFSSVVELLEQLAANPPLAPTQRVATRPAGGPASPPPKAARAPEPRQVVVTAKTIRIEQAQGSAELAVAVERELQKWGRYIVVTNARDADLQLDLAPVADFDMWMGRGAKAIASLTGPQGARLWSTVQGGDWSFAGFSLQSVGKALIKELRKFVEGSV